MSADVLRRASAAMRERAKAATLWELEDGSFVELSWHGESQLCEDHFDDAHAAHIASWHPAVALAVADWLDAATEAFPIDFNEPPRNPRDRALIYAALAVARAYLEGPAP